MGFLDFLLTTRQKQDKVATRICLESGRFVMCPVCHGVTESRDPQASQPVTDDLVSRLVREGRADAELFNRDETEVHRAITRVAKALPYHCICESI
ncbi:MAG: hypothetical protein QNJ78_02470 [Gammaproteobacteria bacterium]|nr:hypothetical protein [Gammaproteobacteria bacterium]